MKHIYTGKFWVNQTVMVDGVRRTVAAINQGKNGHPYKLDDGLYYAESELSAVTPAAPPTAQDYEITDGYVGSLGISWKTATPTALADATAKAATRHGVTVAEIERRLAAGVAVVWCDSPNYYYDHGQGYIRRKRQPKPQPALVRCDCGHSVPQSQVMNASLGTACPDCYDRMSD